YALARLSHRCSSAGYDEPAILSYAISSFCPTSADGLHAEEKIRIVLEGLRGEDSIAELCRKEGINQNLYYRWSKEFLEAGKKRLAGDTAREATSDEVKELKAEARQLKETLAEVLIENRLLKKSVLGDGEDAS